MIQLYKKLSCRRETARRFVNIFVEYFSMSLEVTVGHSKPYHSKAWEAGYGYLFSFVVVVGIA